MKEKTDVTHDSSATDRSIKCEEAELWQKITEDVKPLSKSHKKLKQLTSKIIKPESKARKPELPLLPRASNIETPLVSDWRTSRNLKKGKITIAARLDLHGMTQSEAHKALIDFIDRSHEKNQRCVLVITGKGRAGASIGVLRSNVPKWLNQSPNREKIISYSPAAIKDGGEGALYVLLKRKR